MQVDHHSLGDVAEVMRWDTADERTRYGPSIAAAGSCEPADTGHPTDVKDLIEEIGGKRKYQDEGPQCVKWQIDSINLC